MKSFTAQFKKDTVLAYRNGHIWVVAALAVIMVALIIFIPKEIETGPGEYLLDTLPGSPVRKALLDMGGREESLPLEKESLDKILAEKPNTLGIIISGSLKEPEVEIIQRRNIPEQSVNLLIATLESMLRGTGLGTEEREFPILFARPQAEKVPRNLAGIPIFLAFEVGILGFLLVAVFVFQEKQEGTIRAYRVSPGGLWPYIFSKTLVFTLLSLVYGFIVVAAGFGFKADWPGIIALILWAGAFMTLFGLGFAAWFNNLSQWFFPGLGLLILNMLPFFSYVYPVFNPEWIRFIPSHGLVFSLKESLFPAGDTGLVRDTLLNGLIWLAGAVIFCAYSVKKRLLMGDKA